MLRCIPAGIPRLRRTGAFRTLAMAAALAGSAHADKVKGDLIQFTDNGGWCWYQDERVVVDRKRGELAVSALANSAGVGGSPRDGDVDVVLFDLKTRQGRRHTLREALLSYDGGDDHNATALMVRPAGGYLAMYTGHNNNKISYLRIYDPAKGAWGPEGSFNWNSQPGGASFENSYNNLYFLSAENKTYNFSRGHQQSPNFATSTDQGATWTYGGQLTTFNQDVGYVNGYFKYGSNGVDRIDFTATEHHPRDFNTSIYHGYVKGGKSYNSTGTVIDANVLDKECPIPAKFTKVFGAGTVVSGTSMNHCWNIDVEVYPDGTPAALFKCRAGTVDTDHRFFYAVFREGQWRTTYLGKAGPKLFGSEQDYTGLGTIHPNDPTTIFISTPIHPGDGRALGNHEIFQGKSADQGATWAWSAITEESNRDNYRPSVPAWDKDHTALVWYKGTMTRSQLFDGAMVGVVMEAGSTSGKKVYVDAAAANTALAAGGALDATGPSTANGAADGKWHWRGVQGNGGSVLASAEAGGEDAPVLRTKVSVPAGTYDVWANYLADPAGDWRIRAGLTENSMQVFRQKSGENVDGTDYATAPTLSADGNLLYQAYLGRVEVAAGGSLEVLVDDFPVQTGTASTRIGNTARTWFDGISYAPVSEPPTAIMAKGLRPGASRAAEGSQRDLRGRLLGNGSRGRKARKEGLGAANPDSRGILFSR
jgi:hypothetical protein